MMNLALKMVDFALKMMDFAFEMMGYLEGINRAAALSLDGMYKTPPFSA